jgi:hypothetical protein
LLECMCERVKLADALELLLLIVEKLVLRVKRAPLS